MYMNLMSIEEGMLNEWRLTVHFSLVLVLLPNFVRMQADVVLVKLIADLAVELGVVALICCWIIIIFKFA